MILNRSCGFEDASPTSNPNHLFPIIEERDNGDGTYICRLDLAKMSSKQKLIALALRPTPKFRPNIKGQAIAI